MISKSPETISYISVVPTLTNGNTTEVETIVSGLKCSVQQNTNHLKVYSNGSEIVYRHFIGIYDISEKSKVPDFNINDSITWNGQTFKVLSQRKRQKAIEIYV